MRTQPFHRVAFAHSGLKLCLIGALAGSLAACVEVPEDEDAEAFAEPETEAAERRGPGLSDEVREDATAAATVQQVVIASNSAGKTITCTIKVLDPYRVVYNVWAQSTVSCNGALNAINLTTYLNKGGYRWKQASGTSPNGFTASVSVPGACTGSTTTTFFKAENAYRLTFPSGYSVIQGSASGGFKSNMVSFKC